MPEATETNAVERLKWMIARLYRDAGDSIDMDFAVEVEEVLDAKGGAYSTPAGDRTQDNFSAETPETPAGEPDSLDNSGDEPPVAGVRPEYEPCAVCGQQPTGWFDFADESLLYCGVRPDEGPDYHLWEPASEPTGGQG